jgi:hypothetical protein
MARDESAGASAGRESGSAMVVAMVSLVGLIGVGAIALIAVQGDLSGAANQRFEAAAMHAAEAGAAAAMDALRVQHDPNQHWAALVTPENQDLTLSPVVAGNGVQPGEPGNLFSPDRRSWYEVEIRNNLSDSGFATGQDNDSRVVIRSTGHGPDGARVIIEVEVSGRSLTSEENQVCAGYGQRGLDADGAGRDDCIGVVDSGSTASLRPTE